MLPETLADARSMCVRTIQRTIMDAQDSDLSTLARKLWEQVYQTTTDGELGYHYLTLSMEHPRRIAYANRPSYAFDTSHRTHTTLQRYLIRQLKVIEGDITEDTVARYATLFWSYLGESADQFTVVRGPDITKRYRTQFGYSSCMCGDDDLVRLYELNTSVVAMLCYDGVHGQARALLWTCDSGETVVDRIYPNEGSHIAVFERHAAANGWMYRDHHGLPSSDTAFVNGMGMSMDRLTVTVSVPDGLSVWPYLDTFRFTDQIGSATTLGMRESSIVFNNTDGTYDDSGETCYNCNGRYDADDIVVVYDNQYCHTCCNDLFDCCEHCREYVSNDEANYIDDVGSLCPNCLEASYSTCDKCGEYTPNEVTVRQPTHDLFCPTCHQETKNESEEATPTATAEVR